jgi:serine protease AprX
MAIERGIIVVVSAGNEGNNSWQLVTPPADADRYYSSGFCNSRG